MCQLLKLSMTDRPSALVFVETAIYNVVFHGVMKTTDSLLEFFTVPNQNGHQAGVL